MKMRAPVLKPIKELEAECAAWNRDHPDGTPVIVTRDSGAKQPSRTVGQAFVLSGHTAVIMLEGISGCYLLSRVCADA